MNKQDVITKMSEKVENGTKTQAEKYLQAFIETVKDAYIDSEKVQLVGFGTFETTERAARIGRNPRTREEIQIPASKAPKFKPSQILKDLVKGE